MSWEREEDGTIEAVSIQVLGTAGMLSWVKQCL